MSSGASFPGRGSSGEGRSAIRYRYREIPEHKENDGEDSADQPDGPVCGIPATAT